MNKIYSIAIGILLTASVFAQAPSKMSYQAVIRNTSNALVTSTTVSMRINVLKGSLTGIIVYAETQKPITNANGLVSIEIGTGTAVTGNFATIDWANGPYFIKTETDTKGGTNYTIIGSNELLSVPYALHATTAENFTGTITESDPIYKGSQAANIKAIDITKLSNLSGTNTGDQDLSGLATSSDVTSGLATKVDKEIGKMLSTNDYTASEKSKLADISGTNTGDQDLSGLATSSDVTSGLATKVDKETGKGLSTNDYTTSEQSKLAAIKGTNTGDQDLSGLATSASVTSSLATKVDKVNGKDLSTNDYTTSEQSKLAAIKGTNTGDQDLSGLATSASVSSSLATKVDKETGKGLSTNDYTTSEQSKLAAIKGTNTGDQDLSGLATSASVSSSLATKVDKETGKGLQADGKTLGQMDYWNGSSWVSVSPGSEGQTLTFCDGVPTWREGGICPGKIASLDCETATKSGALYENIPVSSVSSEIPYTTGKIGPYNGQIIVSSGVTGLTATLQAGSFSNANGTLSYIISGTPTSVGTASFEINIGGKSCTLTFTVHQILPVGQFPEGTVHCTDTPMAVVDVINPSTGKTWMDRNLGAKQVATSSTDEDSFGDLYQWGRGPDGHQCRNSITTTTLSSTDVPGNPNFITNSVNHDWRNTHNANLWQGVYGVNNPCPSGYRIPTDTELIEERLSWSPNDFTGAFASPLKLPLGGNRSLDDDSPLYNVGVYGFYWSSTIVENYSRALSIREYVFESERANGFSVRCIKE
jgi:hypothetical protein